MPSCWRALGTSALAAQMALYAASATAQLEPSLLRQAFQAADTDADGVIGEAEYTADAVSAFTGQDQNRNRVLEPDELDETVDAALSGEIDANGDGQLSFDEVMSHKISQFEEADRDDDGALSLDEVRRFNGAGRD